MKEFQARIRRVRMKSGGADLEIIEGWQEPEDESVEATLLRSAREFAESGPLAAIVMVAFDEDGQCLFQGRVENASPIPRTLLPAYISELVRRYILTDTQARIVFDNMFEWSDGPTG